MKSAQQPLDFNPPTKRTPHFDGATYDPAHDQARLTGQIARIAAYMADGAWRTLEEIARGTGDGHASISAQLRNLRKDRFGARTVERRTRGDRSSGLYEYRLVPEVTP